MHVLTHVVTNIKHVYITNKMDRISNSRVNKYLIVTMIYFWITEQLSSNVIEKIPREKTRIESFLHKSFSRKNLSNLFYFLNVQSVSLKNIS